MEFGNGSTRRRVRGGKEGGKDGGWVNGRWSKEDICTGREENKRGKSERKGKIVHLNPPIPKHTHSIVRGGKEGWKEEG